MKRVAGALALAAVLMNCKGPATQSASPELSLNVSSPALLVLRVGDEVRVDSILRVSFHRVASDSRCPSSVVCVWAGDGAVEITHGVGMGPSIPVTLHTTLEPKSVEFQGYVLTLVELTPYPATTNPIPPREYSIRLQVERTPG
jgi:hypothetical protein